MDNATINLDYLAFFGRKGGLRAESRPCRRMCAVARRCAGGGKLSLQVLHCIEAKTMAEGIPAERGGKGIMIKSVGVRWFHPGGFVIDRPHGHAEYTFIQWLTPTILKIGDKTLQEPPGGCIFYPPGETQWYGSDVFTPFGNHWLHFNGPLVPVAIRECGLPLNQPIRLRNDAFIESSLRLFLKESMSPESDRNLSLAAHALLFLVEFGRTLRLNAARGKSARNMELQGKFEEFRECLRERYTEAWTLGKMAAELHLSASRFSNLYREFFAAKPIDDLIRMRIDLAEYYLRTSIMPVNYIANLCGFTDIYYFSRMFKAKTGKTTTAFRSEPGERQE